MKTNLNFTPEQKTIHHLLLRSTFIDDFGLLNGKMGIVIFFYEYAKLKKEVVYSDFAGDLLDDIWEKIHKRVPLGFNSGQSGIAWGIEYLIQNSFVEGDSNEICAEIDQNIMNTDIRRAINSDFIKSDLEGFLHYLLIRFTGSIRQNQTLPFDNLYINDLHLVFSSLWEKKEILPVNTRNLVTLLLRYIQGEKETLYIPDITYLINTKAPRKVNIYNNNLGLKDGLSGQLLKQLIHAKL